MKPFSLILGIGAIFGLLRVLQGSPPAARLRWLAVGLLTLTGALIGARVGFVAAYSAYFRTHLQESFQLTHGGLSWPGALAGAVVIFCLSARLLRLPLLEGLDQMSRILLPMAVAVWLGSWQSGIAYGQNLPAGTWWGIQTMDESGLTSLRVPVQPAAALSLLLVLGFCEWLIRDSKHNGLKSGIIGVVFSIHALLFSFMRMDSVQHFLGLRLDTWAALFLVLAALVYLAVLLRKAQQSKKIVEMEHSYET